MKTVILTDEEAEILEAFEKGELVSIDNFTEEKKKLVEVAKNTLNKTRNINIRLSEKDLQKLKVRAAEDGLPYQTLASSVLHRFAEKREVPN